MDAAHIWQAALERIQTEVSSAVFTTWFQDTSAVSFENGVLTVCATTTFAKTHLEGRFSRQIHIIISDIVGTPVTLQCIVQLERVKPSSPEHKVPPATEDYVQLLKTVATKDDLTKMKQELLDAIKQLKQ